MRALTQWVIGISTSPLGIIILAALDSTIFVSLPFGIDAAVIILAARGDILTLLVPVLAVLGGLAGAAFTYWMGAKAGEKGLDRYVSARKLERVRRRVETSGAIALAALDLMPPPFPFTVFVLAAGALEVRPSMFFITLAAARAIRFGTEALLAALYGRQIVAWLSSDIFHNLVGAFLAFAALLTLATVIGLVRSVRQSPRRAAA